MGLKNKNTKEIIFCVIITKWHLMSLKSFIINNKNKIIIIIKYHVFSDCYRVSKDFVIEALCNYDISVYYDKESNLNFYSKSICIHFICPKEIDIKYFTLLKYVYKIKIRNIVIIDEGFASTYSKKMWINELKAIKNKFLIFKIIIKAIVCFMIKYFYKIEYWELFLKISDKCLKLNDNVFINLNEIYRNTNKQSINLDKTILIISDNISLYLKKDNSELEIYKDIISNLKERYPDYNIKIKLHPSEYDNNHYLDKYVLETKVSVEEIDFNYDCIIMGFCSTSLISLSLFFNKDIISLNNFITKEIISDYGTMKIAQFNKIANILNESKKNNIIYKNIGSIFVHEKV